MELMFLEFKISPWRDRRQNCR